MWCFKIYQEQIAPLNKVSFWKHNLKKIIFALIMYQNCNHFYQIVNFWPKASQRWSLFLAKKWGLFLAKKWGPFIIKMIPRLEGDFVLNIFWSPTYSFLKRYRLTRPMFKFGCNHIWVRPYFSATIFDTIFGRNHIWTI